MDAWRIELPTRRDTVRLATCLGQSAQPGDLLVLSGDLGAGKTFLSRAIARALGIGSDVRFTSPTFTLVHQYRGRIPLVHADLYRISAAQELDELALREARDDGAVLLVEWGEPYVQDLGGDALLLRLELASQGRRATIRSCGDRSAQWLASVSDAAVPVRMGSKNE